uniref:Uncharacterized protein n=1 Tax=Ectopseudomonas mendocina (strain ymp) TaxID=399739 RepID=A4XZH4_ECTM1
MWYDRWWQWAKEHLTITVPGVVVIFAATYLLMLAVNAGQTGAAWVQAAGSILALIVAIAVPARMKRQDDLAREQAQGMRLYTVIWEALRATQQLVNQDRAFRRVQELREQHEAGFEPTIYGTPLPTDRGLRVRQRDVDFFNRIMQRASSNLDDDQCAARLVIASKFRFNLSVLISILQVRVDVPAAGTLLGSLTQARDNFEQDLQKLIELNPLLRGVMGP